MSRFVLHVGPPASSAEPQEFLPADHSISAFASTASNAAKHILQTQYFLILHMQHIKFKPCFKSDKYLTNEVTELLISL